MGIFSKDQTKKVVVNAKNHGYKPDVITFKQGKPAQVKFIASDNMGCMDKINFKQLDAKVDLDNNNEVTVKIPTNKPGEYDFACSMDMFKGKVVVK